MSDLSVRRRSVNVGPEVDIAFLRANQFTYPALDHRRDTAIFRGTAA